VLSAVDFECQAVLIRACENDAVAVADSVTFAHNDISVDVDLSGVHNHFRVVCLRPPSGGFAYQRLIS